MVTLVEDAKKPGTYLIVGYEDYTDSGELTKDLMSLRQKSAGKVISNLNAAMVHINVLRQKKAALEPVEEEEPKSEFATTVNDAIAKWEADFEALSGHYGWVHDMRSAINDKFAYGPSNLHMALFLHRNADLAAKLIFSVQEGKREELARELITALPVRVPSGGSVFAAEAPGEFVALGDVYVIEAFGEVARRVAELKPPPVKPSQLAALARRVFDHQKGYSWTVIFMDRFAKDWPKIAAGQVVGATEVVGDWLKSPYNDHPITGTWMGRNRTPAAVFADEKAGYGKPEVSKIASLLYGVLREREQLEPGAMVSYAAEQRLAVAAVLTPVLGDLAGAVADELVGEAKKNTATV